MGLNYGRGIGAKAARTKKCSCENPKWEVDEVRISINREAVLTLHCNTCKAFWDTKSRAAREYANLDRVPHPFKKTYREIFAETDASRVEMLEGHIKAQKHIIKEAEKEIAKTHREIDLLKGGE